MRIPGGDAGSSSRRPGPRSPPPHGERSPSSRPRNPLQGNPKSPPRPFPVPPHLGSTVTLTRLEGSQSAQADLGPTPGPHLARNAGGKTACCSTELRHSRPQTAQPTTSKSRAPRRALHQVTPTWYSLIGLRVSFCPITGSIQPRPAFDWKLESCPRADWLGCPHFGS